MKMSGKLVSYTWCLNYSAVSIIV